ncbi:DUF5710 domain-containing protein (plasmid) [Methylomarinum sp. Ch1-1]|uniref:DUF5710 domain-containing protein n=1 Tax=Methylomarinum roseum TaxID=3067653 RepID=A0AAU7P0D7_9GAMM|nr:DUF5710 domain-containing protein [Methylomarinum sp. Ch1-1]MDP4523260.1 DUF5710 domain-containing protein [Methylomarinum sp. Ch1-1]
MTTKIRNQIVLTSATHYLVDSPWRSVDTRVFVVAEGACNDKTFGAILSNDPGLHSSADLFSEEHIHFDKAEYQSIRRALKKANEQNKVIDRRGESVSGYHPNLYEKLYRQLEEKYLGQKVYLNVSFEEKEAVKALGACWDGGARRWFVMSKSANFDQLTNWLPEEFCNLLSLA